MRLNSNYLNPNNYKLWITIALLIKCALLLFQISQNRPNEIPGFIGNVGGDTESYLAPLANLIQSGVYAPDYRMPGYAVFLPLFFVFSKAMACNIIIFIQTIIAAISVYCVARIAFYCFKSDTMFYVVFLGYAISAYTSLWDSYILSESLCTSSTIFSVYFLLGFIQNRKPYNLILSGLFLTWMYFLRPMYAPLVLLFPLFLLFHEIKIKSTWPVVFRNLTLMLGAVVLLELSWVYRNYKVHNKISILTTTLYSIEFEASYQRELMDFVKSWGGDRTWWNPDSEMRWFGVFENQTRGIKPLENKNIRLPADIYTTQFNIDSLEKIKTYVHLINSDETSSALKKSYTSLIKRKLILYTESVKKEKIFLYYFKGPILLFNRFLFHSGTYNLFNKPASDLNYFELLIKVCYSLLYLLCLLLGILGLIKIIFNFRQAELETLLICAILLYSLLLFPIILKQIEYRYFVPAYPFLLVLASHMALSLYNFTKTFLARA